MNIETNIDRGEHNLNTETNIDMDTKVNTEANTD